MRAKVWAMYLYGVGECARVEGEWGHGVGECARGVGDFDVPHKV